MNTTTGPLTGIRVLELGSFIAAPTAGKLLGDFGADVIKVERPRVGDELRTWRMHSASKTSILFRTLARNKRSMTVDLKHPDGKEIIERLLTSSDIVLENFRPGTLERLGLGPERIAELNPRAVLVRISGYGQSGPYRDRPGFGGVAESIGGLRHIVGYPDRPPVRVGISLADTVAGMNAVIGALLGLIARGTDGAGETVDVALYEAVFSLMEDLLPEHSAFGVEREPAGSGLPGIVPSNSFRCADGEYIIVSGNGDAIFQRLMIAIGRDDLASDPRLASNAGRVTHITEVEDALADWAGGVSAGEALTILEEAEVPSGPIYRAADILKDPHFAAREMLDTRQVEVEHGAPRDVVFPGVVPRLSEHPGSVRWLGPELGEHTDEVLAELGFDESERSGLRERGVIS